MSAKHWELDYADRNWMIKLGSLTKVASRIVIKNFKPTSPSVGFVKTILSENDFFIASWGNDLSFQKRPKYLRKT